jgi:hypothetical protein
LNSVVMLPGDWMLWNGSLTRPKPDLEIVVADGLRRPSLQKTNGARFGKRPLYVWVKLCSRRRQQKRVLEFSRGFTVFLR